MTEIRLPPPPLPESPPGPVLIAGPGLSDTGAA